MDAHVTVYKATEHWRRVCEARAVLAMPGLDARRKFLDLVEKKRGRAGRDLLEADILEQWRMKRAA